MMVPLCLEAVRCLEDGIVDSAAEADMGLIYGIGFRPSGAVRCATSTAWAWPNSRHGDQYADLGPLYHPTPKLREMAAAGQRFFG